jgi:nitroimidazol reductase NimA-like FMN-containing flavoprotein (pyridoxamine 5'-phosphate oxidase superfamily)
MAAWLEILSDAECWRLLRLSPIGRLAADVDGEPMIWPLNIVVDGEAVVFRTGPGSKLATLEDLPKAALEVDGLDVDAKRGWSVVARGRVVELAGDALDRAHRLPLVPWTVGEKPCWFALQVRAISGRSIEDQGPPEGEAKVLVARGTPPGAAKRPVADR